MTIENHLVRHASLYARCPKVPIRNDTELPNVIPRMFKMIKDHEATQVGYMDCYLYSGRQIPRCE